MRILRCTEFKGRKAVHRPPPMTDDLATIRKQAQSVGDQQFRAGLRNLGTRSTERSVPELSLPGDVVQRLTDKIRRT